MRFQYIVCFLLIFMRIQSYSQKPDSLAIEHLKSKIENQNERISVSIEREDRFLSNLEIFFVFVSLVVSALGLFGVKSIFEVKKEYEEKVKEAKSELEKKLLEETNNLKNENIRTINKLIIKESLESQLIIKSNIIVINPIPEGDSPYLTKILSEFKHSILPDSFSDRSIVGKINLKIINGALNIVILEDSDGRWNIDNRDDSNKSIAEAAFILENLPQDVFLLYFGPGFFPDKKRNFPDWSIDNYKNIIARVAFTNVPSKLYINILDTLRFMHLIQNS